MTDRRVPKEHLDKPEVREGIEYARRRARKLGERLAASYVTPGDAALVAQKVRELRLLENDDHPDGSSDPLD